MALPPVPLPRPPPPPPLFTRLTRNRRRRKTPARRPPPLNPLPVRRRRRTSVSTCRRTRSLLATEVRHRVAYPCFLLVESRPGVTTASHLVNSYARLCLSLSLNPSFPIVAHLFAPVLPLSPLLALVPLAFHLLGRFPWSPILSLSLSLSLTARAAVTRRSDVGGLGAPSRSVVG